MPVNRFKRRRSKGASSSSSSLEKGRGRRGGGGISRGKINVSRRAIISRLAPCNFVGVLSRSLHESLRRKHGRRFFYDCGSNGRRDFRISGNFRLQDPANDRFKLVPPVPLSPSFFPSFLPRPNIATIIPVILHSFETWASVWNLSFSFLFGTRIFPFPFFLARNWLTLKRCKRVLVFFIMKGCEIFVYYFLSNFLMKF